MGENKPCTGSFSLLGTQVNNGKPRKSLRFCSCGECAHISLRLPKYGRITPHLLAANGHRIEVIFALCFTLFDMTFAKGSPAIDVIFSRDV